MATIPTTCPGCQAVFEVPDALAGKTIRCTSCKAQMTVPAAVATTVPGTTATPAKKPFGWAGGNGPPKPEPLSLDDEPATAKTSPNRPAAKPAAAAKPTAKPVVKTDVAVDDDEDDAPAKPKPKAAAKPAGAKGSPKTTRRDDDDDDDDDDRPRKKRKNTGGGAGGMYAIIGGGVLALAAVIGLGVWLLMGDGKKKDETAKSGDTPPAATTPDGTGPGGPGGPGRGGPGRGGRPVETGPGGGGPADGPPPVISDEPVAAGGWQAFTLDGFTADMPGVPVDRTAELAAAAGGAPGVQMKAYVLEAAGKDQGYLVIAMTLPPEAAAAPTAVLLNEMVKGMEAGMSGAAGGLGGFGGGAPIRVSAKSDIKQDGFPGKELKLAAKTGGATVGTLRMVLVGNKVYMYGAYFASFAAMQADVQKFVDSTRITGGAGGGVAIGGPGGEGSPPGPGVPPQPGTAPGTITLPGVGGPGGGGSVPPRLQPAGEGVPGPGGSIPPRPQPAGGGEGAPGGGGSIPPRPGTGGAGEGQPEPGGIPPQPGGIGPMPGGIGQPGGFGQPGGSGDSVVLHKSVGAFTAGAFDPSAKELVTVGLRPDSKGKAAGTITRHGYPKFEGKGTVHIPTVATRAVIDSKKGLLYLAGVTNPNGALVSRDMFDRGAYAGDVVVYDLQPLRAGKVEEKSDVKPTAIFPVGNKVIRGLDLSEDGKTLFVLATPASGLRPKSQLLAYDTADPKKAPRMKELPEPGWKLTRTSDGAKLLVSGLAAPGANAVPPGISVIDPVTLALGTSLPLPTNGGFDFIAFKDGRLLVSTPPKAAGAFDLQVVEADGTLGTTFPGYAGGASNNGYVEFTPDGKYLLVSSHHPQASGAGADIYQLTDKLAIEKRVTGAKKAGESPLGGTFLVAPDSDFVVFNNGVVLKFDDLGVVAGGAGAFGAVPGAGGIAGPGGIVPPGGIAPPAIGGAGPGPGGIILPGAGGPGGVPPGPGAGPGPGGAPMPIGGPGRPGGRPNPGGRPPGPGGRPGGM